MTALIPEWKLRKSISAVTRVKIETMKIWVKRASKATCATVACGLALSACGFAGSSDDSVAATVAHFADELSRQNAETAASYTTAPGQAGDVLTATLAGMRADKIDVEVRNPVEYADGTASFSLKTTYAWQSERSFETTTSGTARHLSSGWKITWTPSILHSDLVTGGALREIRTDATPAPTVRSRSGKPFMYLQPVNEVILDPSATKDTGATVRALVRSLAPIAPLITTAVLNDELGKAQGKAITAVTLRDTDMEVLASDPGRIAGVSVRRTGKLVMVDRRLSSPLEAGITNYWQAIRDATAGWQVQLSNPGVRPARLAGEQGPAGPDVPTTIDQGVQLTLGDAAVEVAQPATILTLDAGSGAILGMAQNGAAADRGINVGAQYPVGSTLDPVRGAVEGPVAGKQSSDSSLDRLGLGVGFTVAGASAPGQSLPGVSTVDYRPGQATSSMLNMGALGVALARVVNGQPSSVAPYVIKGVPTKVTEGQLGGLDPALSDPILRSMTATAKNGDASDLTGAPGLKALVGTNGPQGPGWFVGLQGGKVIVIYTEGEKSGTAALQVAQKYFRIK